VYQNAKAPYNEQYWGRQVHEPVHIGAEANFLTRLQHLSDVAHPSDLSSAPAKIELAQGYSAHAALPRCAISRKSRPFELQNRGQRCTAEHVGLVVRLSLERFAGQNNSGKVVDGADAARDQAAGTQPLATPGDAHRANSPQRPIRVEARAQVLPSDGGSRGGCP